VADIGSLKVTRRSSSNKKSLRSISASRNEQYSQTEAELYFNASQWVTASDVPNDKNFMFLMNQVTVKCV